MPLKNKKKMWNDASNTDSEKKNIPLLDYSTGRLLRINPQCITLSSWDIYDTYRPDYEKKSKITKGTKCLIGEEEIEGFKIEGKKYEVKGYISEYSNQNINAYVCKEITDNTSSKYSLSRIECEHFGIPFEPGLELVLNTEDFKPYQEKDDRHFSINDSNLGLYPAPYGVKDIPFIFVDIMGFSMYDEGLIQCPVKEPYFICKDKILDSLNVVRLGHELRGSIVLNEIAKNGILHLELEIPPDITREDLKWESLSDELFKFNILGYELSRPICNTIKIKSTPSLKTYDTHNLTCDKVLPMNSFYKSMPSLKISDTDDILRDSLLSTNSNFNTISTKYIYREKF
jgi:hypothetical protein